MRWFFLLLILLPLYGYSQTIRDIVQRHWKCVITDANLTIGEVNADTIIQQLYSLEVRASGDYAGMCGTTIIFKRKKYSAICRISGRLIVQEKAGKAYLTYTEGEVIMQDKFPDNRDWCNERGRLYIYQDKSRPGDYFLEGKIACDGYALSTRIFR